MESEFIFWDKDIALAREDINIYNIVLQFDLGAGSKEYSLAQLKTAGLKYRDAAGALTFIICVYKDASCEYLAFIHIDDGTIEYNFIRKGEENPCEFEGRDIVAANIFGIVDDALYENLGE